MQESQQFQLNKTDFIKILKGLFIAMVGSAVVYLLTVLKTLPTTSEIVFLSGLASTLLNILLKYINSHNNQNI